MIKIFVIIICIILLAVWFSVKQPNVILADTKLQKLYSQKNGILHYWESWPNQDGKSVTIHWGEVGQKGDSLVLTSDSESGLVKKLDEKRNELVDYDVMPIANHFVLLVEFQVNEMGTLADLEKRNALFDRLDNLLGWTGLGYCDGGSIGSGTMEVACFVVDFEIAKKVIEQDLLGTEFSDFTRIYDENAGDK